jgi:hypothetical protein
VGGGRILTRSDEAGVKIWRAFLEMIQKKSVELEDAFAVI